MYVFALRRTAYFYLTYAPWSALWQATERASVRLAARTHTPDPQAGVITGGRYPQATYYQHSGMYEPSHQYPQQVSLPPSNEDSQTQSKSTKRTLSDGDDSQAPKSKRPKGKSSKGGSTPSTSAAGTFFLCMYACRVLYMWSATFFGLVELCPLYPFFSWPI